MTTDITVLAADTLTRTSTAEAVTFWIFGAIALAGAIGVVAAPKAVYAAIFLATTMICVVQIVVYTGAVMMLFLFVVMLIGVDSAQSLVETIRGQRFAAIASGLGFGLLLAAAIGTMTTSEFVGMTRANEGGNVQGLADLIFTRNLWAFELTSALLITAALGAMVLAHRERFEARKTQRELAVERFRDGSRATPLPNPGVYARHNAVDSMARLPDGSDERSSVSDTLRGGR